MRSEVFVVLLSSALLLAAEASSGPCIKPGFFAIDNNDVEFLACYRRQTGELVARHLKCHLDHKFDAAAGDCVPVIRTAAEGDDNVAEPTVPPVETTTPKDIETPTIPTTTTAKDIETPTIPTTTSNPTDNPSIGPDASTETTTVETTEGTTEETTETTTEETTETTTETSTTEETTETTTEETTETTTEETTETTTETSTTEETTETTTEETTETTTETSTTEETTETTTETSTTEETTETTTETSTTEETTEPTTTVDDTTTTIGEDTTAQTTEETTEGTTEETTEGTTVETTEGTTVETTEGTTAETTEGTTEQTTTVETTTNEDDTTTVETTTKAPYFCPTFGFFPQSGNCSRYVLCAEIDDELIPIFLECRPGFYFDPFLGFCDMNYICPDSARRLASVFDCPMAGNFAYEGDCRKYWHCDWNAATQSYAIEVQQCTEGEVFSRFTKRCGSESLLTCLKRPIGSKYSVAQN